MTTLSGSPLSMNVQDVDVSYVVLAAAGVVVVTTRAVVTSVIEPTVASILRMRMRAKPPRLTSH